MKRLFFSSALILGLALFYTSCKKEKNEIKPEDDVTVTVPLSFDSLSALKSKIQIGEETTVTASVKGTNISYQWQASTGTIVGQASQVSYGSSCASCKGDNTVSCTVSDGKTSITKSIIISIK